MRTEYLGSGEIGWMMMELEREGQDEQAAKQKKLHLERKADRQLDRQIDEVARLARLTMQAALLASGYHKHKGQWRKRRDGKSSTSI